MSTAVAYRHHENVVSSDFADTPAFDSAATRLAKVMAQQVGRLDWAFLHPAAYGAMIFVARCLQRDESGVRLPDQAQPGQVFLIFAGGDVRGFTCGGNVEIDEIEAARTAFIYATASERRQRLGEIVKKARDRHQQMGDAVSRELAIECAGLLIDPDEVEALSDIDDALPAFVILTRQ